MKYIIGAIIGVIIGAIILSAYLNWKNHQYIKEEKRKDDIRRGKVN